MEVYPNENENNDNNNNKASRSKSNFYADPSVPSLFQVKPDSYLHLQDGLSRGHLAPAQSYKHSQIEMDNTFNMNANIVPQDMTLNALDWLRLENLVRKIGKQISNHKDNKLYVISGPAFVSQEVRQVTTEQQQQAVLLETSHTTAGRPKTVIQHDVVGRGPHGPTVAVPTHLFKVLLSASNKEYHAAAFLFPNKPLSEERPLTSYQVPLSRLESLTGLQFFPQLPPNQKKIF
ncbi:endonuclease G, mitochondrial [Angomonas deanei]|nr:endonuclease G, mitochondrial [Angomonas deanei]|eukprot:EPY38475.1 endonuclease G, mitochondrial [Angomonas deanei]